jgi:hypothetical protein
LAWVPGEPAALDVAEAQRNEAPVVLAVLDVAERPQAEALDELAVLDVAERPPAEALDEPAVLVSIPGALAASVPATPAVPDVAPARAGVVGELVLPVSVLDELVGQVTPVAAPQVEGLLAPSVRDVFVAQDVRSAAAGIVPVRAVPVWVLPQPGSRQPEDAPPVRGTELRSGAQRQEPPDALHLLWERIAPDWWTPVAHAGSARLLEACGGHALQPIPAEWAVHRFPRVRRYNWSGCRDRSAPGSCRCCGRP